MTTTNSPIGQAAFDPDTTSLLVAAFETAWATVRKSGSPLASSEQAAASRELLARHLIARVQSGERDPKKLVEDALAYLTAPR